jgi:16S rRNA (adenine1518-N6/adenine1519-N6)-dimethyltransferase
MAPDGRPERARADLPRARRRFGQNFLVDPGIARRLVEEIAPRRGEAVLEIGPGRGALTEHLLARMERIAAIEIDRDLARLLRGRFDETRLALLEGDVLRLDLGEVETALGLPSPTPFVVVGSLPYNISKPVARRLVDERERISRAMLVFQREVAERLTANAGTRAYGPLTVLVGAAYDVRAIASLPPEAFRPRPEVQSIATLWTPRPLPDQDARFLERLAECLAASFARRRQTILRNLREALGVEETARRTLLAAGIDPALRAEAVDAERFTELARLWPGTPRAR